MSGLITIAVDAMGGDRAPAAIVEGALAALEAHDDLELHLVGLPSAVEACLNGTRPSRLKLVEAEDVVTMDDHPGKAVRRKPKSSIAICGRLMKEGKVSALVSAGNTGAVIATSMFAARLLPGVHRPGIAIALPSRGGAAAVLCDAGANINMKPVHYLQYAVMASVYSKHILEVEAPKVGLLNIGTEAGKGGSELQQIRSMLETAGKDGLIHFVGAVEGNHIFEGKADVVVCDGFTGNTILKTAEGAGRVILEDILAFGQEQGPEVEQSDLFQSLLRRLTTLSAYSSYGGAPLLGIDGCAIIAHGRSDARAIHNAISVARGFTRHEVNQHIVDRLGELATNGVGSA